MKKFRLLDTFCKAGGAGMGYRQAGFEVVGVDIEPQKRYPFEFHQSDALEFIRNHGHEFDVIHASPPCQRYSKATAWRGNRLAHPDLIASTRDCLLITGKPYIIENVRDARMLLRNSIMLCGTMFGLNLQRHRYFEVKPMPFFFVPQCLHSPGNYSHDHGFKQSESVYRDAMDCEWMTVHEARQAIPPAYTHWIGRQLMAYLQRKSDVA